MILVLQTTFRSAGRHSGLYVVDFFRLKPFLLPQLETFVAKFLETQKNITFILFYAVPKYFAAKRRNPQSIRRIREIF